MNNFPFPIPIPPTQTPIDIQNILKNLENRISKLEKELIEIKNKNQDNYLKKDDYYHMI